MSDQTGGDRAALLRLVERLIAKVAEWRVSADEHRKLSDDAYRRGRDNLSTKYDGATAALRACANELEDLLRADPAPAPVPERTPTVTRFEVIDANGRSYVRHRCRIELSYQDDGRTLKVFVHESSASERTEPS